MQLNSSYEDTRASKVDGLDGALQLGLYSAAGNATLEKSHEDLDRFSATFTYDFMAAKFVRSEWPEHEGQAI